MIIPVIAHHLPAVIYILAHARQFRGPLRLFLYFGFKVACQIKAFPNTLVHTMFIIHAGALNVPG